MRELLYSASDIAMIVCIHDLGTKAQIDLLQKIWAYERLFLEPEIAEDRKKFFTDVEHQCHYYYDKVKMDSEFPIIEKDIHILATGGSIDKEKYFSGFENIGFFFKNLRYRILYMGTTDYVRMKIRTLMSEYGYKRRSLQFIDYLKKCLNFYHICTFSRGNVSCDITTESLDTVISFRICKK